MKVLSLFSGVGGFDLGLENAGMETVFQCEWDKHAVKILEKHWPHVPRWDDVSTLTGEHILRHAPVIDVVAWGSPCQDLSVAGKRAGLQGARSGLFHEGVRIIKELRELTNGKYPRISIWENVAGALSSGGGADFGQVLYEMDEAGACFSEWRILDAQYFGVPQRRRRVFLVSVFDPATAARCPDPLLPVSEGVQWHPATSNQARQTVTGEVAGCLRSGGFRMRGFGDYESDDSAAIPIQDGRDMEKHQNGLGVADEGAPSYTLDQTGAQAVAFGLQGNMIGRQDHNGPQGAGISHPDDPMFSLTSTDRHAVAHVAAGFKAGQSSAAGIGYQEGVSQTLASQMSGVEPTVLTPTMAVRRLTPLECERLMGWPDDWTAGQSDTHRYKQCGNGVASPVATWIAQQLMELDQ